MDDPMMQVVLGGILLAVVVMIVGIRRGWRQNKDVLRRPHPTRFQD